MFLFVAGRNFRTDSVFGAGSALDAGSVSSAPTASVSWTPAMWTGIGGSVQKRRCDPRPKATTRCEIGLGVQLSRCRRKRPRVDGGVRKGSPARVPTDGILAQRMGGGLLFVRQREKREESQQDCVIVHDGNKRFCSHGQLRIENNGRC
mmetsp:Transcript_81832/g.219770  ORF Transcript_81832/g.219770 Transcript_81832/m.219770 type:complete len:149 (+) Transcript_81832:204-650(+)